MYDLELASLYLGKEAHYLNPGHIEGLRRVAAAVFEETKAKVIESDWYYGQQIMYYMENVYEED